tara:strand:+ start:804 stop:1847 length:1044 start_codon:yes stop_codon:yes gene_type:complete
MKILYAIQGTGNGHICRAKEIIPYLQKYGDLDILVSGIQSDIALPFEVTYAFKGMSFVFGKKGGIDLLNTYVKNHINTFMKEVKSLPVEKYDLVINDFEPISAWASYLKNSNCVALSNQCAIRSHAIPKPKSEDFIGKFIINHYAPSTAEYGFHYQPYAPHIFTPIIRKEVREMQKENLGHYTVYLPAFDSKNLIKKLSLIKEVKWEVFAKNCKERISHDNVEVYPIQSNLFMKSMATSAGVLSAAGFGTTSEALFLKKKLLVIPQKQQYEQQCNALALKKLSVPIIKNLRKKNLLKIQAWIREEQNIEVNFPDQTELIIDTIINNEFHHKDNYLDYLTSNQFNTAD